MNQNPVKILIAGDFCPHNRIENLARNKEFGTIFNDFLNVFKGNDLNLVDLECPLTLSDSERIKVGPHQRAHPECIYVLKYADVGLVALANNHIMDYGYSGVSDTLRLCSEHFIDTVGVGRTVYEAAKPFMGVFKEKKIAVFNFADDEFIKAPDKSFVCNKLDPIQAFYRIRDYRSIADFIIVIVHAGNEFYSLPSPRTKKLYRFLVDAGADVIVANHTHAFSGYEVYNTKPIFYGLGNFIYDHPGRCDSSWNTGFAIRLLFSNKIDFELIPLKQNNKMPGVFHLKSDEDSHFKKEISRLNEIIVDQEKLQQEFDKYCGQVSEMYDSFLEPYFGRIITALRVRNLFPKLISKRKRMLLLNLFRCESHREVMVRLLEGFE